MSRRMRASFGSSGSLFLAVAVAGCGGTATVTPSQAPSGGGAATVAVTEQDFSITPSPGDVAAGTVTFNVTNSGTIEHEFVILGPTGLPVDQMPSDDAGQTVDEDEVGGKGEIEGIAAATSKSLTVDLPAGSYVLICNIATHYTSGMRVAFTVH